jgi:competence protein ComEA
MQWMSKSRYRGTVLLATGIFMLGLLDFLYSQYRMQDFSEEDSLEESRALDSLLALIPAPLQADYPSKEESLPEAKGEAVFRPSVFNPNQVDESQWLSMGLPLKAFQSLERYRKKGGVFRKADQVFKIPHLSPEQAKDLLAWIQLDSAKGRQWGSFSKTKKDGGPLLPFDLNLADSLQLKKVFGIGSKTASRILRYREDLGGFVDKKQLYEVWGLDSLVAEELMDIGFLTSNSALRKINPNTAEEEELAKHPYIRKGLARLIVRYRKQHAPFAKPEDLLGIRLIRPEQVEKMRPYLTF